MDWTKWQKKNTFVLSSTAQKQLMRRCCDLERRVTPLSRVCVWKSFVVAEKVKSCFFPVETEWVVTEQHIFTRQISPCAVVILSLQSITVSLWLLDLFIRRKQVRVTPIHCSDVSTNAQNKIDILCQMTFSIAFTKTLRLGQFTGFTGWICWKGTHLFSNKYDFYYKWNVHYFYVYFT